MSIENTARTIKVIPANNLKEINSAKPKRKELVCAYARVSTDSEDQLNSYKVQCNYYNEKLSHDPNITYVGLYKDEGKTGTKMRKRSGFLEMLEDCRAGKITRIVTKSVQRFARNTSECLNIARELYDKGITILFETSGIDTADPNSWLILGIMATIAEEESRTISHNITWSHQKKFEKGVYVGSGRIYGYDIKNGFKIIPKEAVVVKRIYNSYLNGKTLNNIKTELETDHVPSPKGKDKWFINTILGILTNEKYKGDLLLQKTYKSDVLCERKINDGAKPQYYIKDDHLPIISKEDFDAVQIELKKRETGKSEDDNLGSYTNGYAFSSLIECGECGAKYRRHCQWSVDHSKKVPIWVCTQHQKNHAKCSAKPIKEECLEQGFMECLQLLTSQRTDILEKIKANINTVLETPNTQDLDGMITALETKQQELIKLNKTSGKDIDAQKQSSKLIEEIKDLQDKIEIARKNTSNLSIINYRIKEIEKVLKGTYTTFSKDICKALLEKVIIKSKHEATFIFKCGIALDQAI